MAGETALLTPLEAADQDFMEQMTYEAAIGGLREPHSFREIMGTGRLESCFAEWGRATDDGLLAMDEAGEPMGAAWRRVFPDRYAGLGEGPSFTPQVMMAVRSEHRGRGVGGALLEGLIGQAREAGVPRLRLDVVTRNLPALQLYESRGFTKIDRTITVIGTEAVYSWRMARWTADR